MRHIARHVQCFGGPRDGQQYTVTTDILPIGDDGGEYVLASRFTQQRQHRAPGNPFPAAPGYEYYLRWVPEPKAAA